MFLSAKGPVGLCISQDTLDRNAMFNVFLERNVEYIAAATPAQLGLQYLDLLRNYNYDEREHVIFF
jgi:hypothetical protein